MLGLSRGEESGEGKKGISPLVLEETNRNSYQNQK